MSSQQLNRRRLLQAAGVTLALPLLQSWSPVDAAEKERRVTPESDGKPRRMVFICNNLGLHMPFFVPQQTGFDYKPSPYLEIPGDLRQKATVFSGISHPHVDGGHAAEKSFLTPFPWTTIKSNRDKALAASCRRGVGCVSRGGKMPPLRFSNLQDALCRGPGAGTFDVSRFRPLKNVLSQAIPSTALRVKHRLLEHLEIASDRPEVHEWEGELLRSR